MWEWIVFQKKHLGKIDPQFDEHIFQMGREKPANSSLSLQQNIHKTGEEQVSTKARSLPLKLSPEKKIPSLNCQA